jgi:hypothetical protein
VAIVKATNHVECPPKERHLRSALIHYYTLYFRVLKLLPNLVFMEVGIRSCLQVGEAVNEGRV